MKFEKGELILYMLLIVLMLWSFYIIKMTGQFIK